MKCNHSADLNRGPKPFRRLKKILEEALEGLVRPLRKGLITYKALRDRIRPLSALSVPMKFLRFMVRSFRLRECEVTQKQRLVLIRTYLTMPLKGSQGHVGRS